MSVANQFGLAHDEILDHYNVRIDKGDRTKLTCDKPEQLALLLVDELVDLNQQGHGDQAAIQELCEKEKVLLERGYPKSSLKSAIVQGRLGKCLCC